jgi:hypothetical protein
MLTNAIVIETDRDVPTLYNRFVSTIRGQGRGVLQALEGACRGEPLSVRKRAG